MSSIQERKKQRWEYLNQKGGAYATLGLITFATGFCALMTLTFVLTVAIFPPGIVVGLCFGVVTLRLTVLVRQAHRTVKQLPYVPPVTADTLPAEEVLVRGSQEPTLEQGKVLLRGIQSSPGAGETELLRISQKQDHRP